MTASIAMHESGWLKGGGIYEKSGGTNPFGQTGKGPLPSIIGADGQPHRVYASLDEGVAHHVERWGQHYRGTPQETLKNLVGHGYNTVNSGWSPAIQGTYDKMALRGLSGASGVDEAGFIGAIGGVHPGSPIGGEGAGMMGGETLAARPLFDELDEEGFKPGSAFDMAVPPLRPAGGLGGAEFKGAGELGAAAEMTHKVEGSGTIDVNVNAPRGTSVKADSGGMFKDVNLNRQFSMPQADERGASGDSGGGGGGATYEE
jgi:hypothetical protein